jgi:hypothetical protein
MFKNIVKTHHGVLPLVARLFTKWMEISKISSVKFAKNTIVLDADVFIMLIELALNIKNIKILVKKIKNFMIS